MSCIDISIGYLIFLIGVVLILGGIGTYYIFKDPTSHCLPPMPPIKNPEATP